MSEIRSDFEGASQKATALKKSADMLQQESTIENDNQTTVTGNMTAHEVIFQAQESAKQIAEAIMQASVNLQSVAEDFKIADEQFENIISKIGKL